MCVFTPNKIPVRHKCDQKIWEQLVRRGASIGVRCARFIKNELKIMAKRHKLLPLSWESTDIWRLNGYFANLNGGLDTFMWLLTGPVSTVTSLLVVDPFASSLNSGNAVCLNGYLQGDLGGSISKASFPTPSDGPLFDKVLCCKVNTNLFTNLFVSMYTTLVSTTRNYELNIWVPQNFTAEPRARRFFKFGIFFLLRFSNVTIFYDYVSVIGGIVVYLEHCAEFVWKNCVYGRYNKTHDDAQNT